MSTRVAAVAGKYEQHPIAAKLMPWDMSPEEYEAFKDDVAERGVIMPCYLYEGKLLDGKHRYRAAAETGGTVELREYTGKDPAGFVASANVLRRKLSSLQRALVGVRLHLDHGVTQRIVCKRLGISNEVVALVLKAVNSKSAKLIKRIEEDAEFTRGMLKEELRDAGLLQAKAPEPAPAPGPNSVFELGTRTGKEGQGQISDAAARMGLPDTDGTNDDDEPPEEPGTPTGKKAADRAAKKPKATAAQTLAEGFQAMLLEDKLSFLKIIAPTVRAMAKDGYDTTLVERPVVPPPAKKRAANEADLLAPKGKKTGSKK